MHRFNPFYVQAKSGYSVAYTFSQKTNFYKIVSIFLLILLTTQKNSSRKKSFFILSHFSDFLHAEIAK